MFPSWNNILSSLKTQLQDKACDSGFLNHLHVISDFLKLFEQVDLDRHKSIQNSFSIWIALLPSSGLKKHFTASQVDKPKQLKLL